MTDFARQVPKNFSGDNFFGRLYSDDYILPVSLYVCLFVRLLVCSRQYVSLMHLSMFSPRGGGPGIPGGFDIVCLPEGGEK